MGIVKGVWIDEVSKPVQKDILENTAGEFLLFAKVNSIALVWLDANQINPRLAKIITAPHQAAEYKNIPVYVLNSHDLSADLIRAAQRVNWPNTLTYVYTWDM